MTLTSASLNFPLDKQGIATNADIHANLGTAPLVEHAVRNGEGVLAADGPLVVATGKHTGRSAKDKFIVRDAGTEDTVWWGKTNDGMTPAHFAASIDENFRAAQAGSGWQVRESVTDHALSTPPPPRPPPRELEPWRATRIEASQTPNAEPAPEREMDPPPPAPLVLPAP